MNMGFADPRMFIRQGRTADNKENSKGRGTKKGANGARNRFDFRFSDDFRRVCFCGRQERE
jgi:hypothetical protein